jgi:hypothetical protein
MIEWTYAQVEGHCGGCGTQLAVGNPMQLTHIVGVTRAFVRCVECAGGVPADLPPFVPPTPPPSHEPRPPVERRRQPNEWMPYRDAE